ncbi:unnamed protein product, partial [Polarella glacialis]
RTLAPTRIPPRVEPSELLGVVELDPAADEEKAVLEAIYGSEFSVFGPAEWGLDIPGQPSCPQAVLRVMLPAGYPRSGEPPVLVVECEGDPKAVMEAAAE